MPKPSQATDADWALVQALYEENASWADCKRAIDGRATEPTIKRRAAREGWQRTDGLPVSPTLEQRQAKTAHAREAAFLKWANEKDRILSKLINRLDVLLDEMVAPHEIIDVKVVSDGKDEGSHVETVRTRVPSPPPGDKQRLMTSAAIAIDKIQLVAGEATSRNEQIAAGDRDAAVARAKELRDEVGARREAKEAEAV